MRVRALLFVGCSAAAGIPVALVWWVVVQWLWSLL